MSAAFSLAQPEVGEPDRHGSRGDLELLSEQVGVLDALAPHAHHQPLRCEEAGGEVTPRR